MWQEEKQKQNNKNKETMHAKENQLNTAFLFFEEETNISLADTGL